MENCRSSDTREVRSDRGIHPGPGPHLVTGCGRPAGHFFNIGKRALAAIPTMLATSVTPEAFKNVGILAGQMAVPGFALAVEGTRFERE